ncbi:DUF2339 domain-containing protein [Nocardiopsis deserti]|uniref:hypothetical protein n=1 Tax=Nocardiopsis deserti TaxID=2605988 RepID=UPI001239D235|nr:hypothetical protein [Nocardiopsis deserti]
MSTAPDPPPGSAPSSDPAPAPSSGPASGSGPTPAPGRGAVWTVVAAATLYPLLVGAALWAGGMFALLGLLYSDWSYTVLLAVAALASVGGGHCLFLWILRRQGVPRPWEFPTVLSTALALALFQMPLVALLSLDGFPPLPLTCLGLSLLGTVTLAALRHRHRFVFALALVVAAALLLHGTSWMTAVENQRRDRDELLGEVADFPVAIAVLDSPDWEPSGVQVVDNDVQEKSADITYVPVDPSPGLDGFGLTLRSHPLEGEHESGWTPLYELCDLEDGPWECEEHGDTVIAVDAEGEEVEFMEARTEFTDGVRATLMTDLPDDSQGVPTMEFPDIDMARLSEHIREAGPGEAEEIVFAVTE